MSNVTMGALLAQTAARHHHLCPRQVLGVRMGMLAGALLGLDLPQSDKRLFAFMETDGCASDGVAVATGAWVGRRTMRMMDFGKVAATFVDTQSQAAVRIHPHPDSREKAIGAAREAADRWHAQLLGYQRLPDDELLVAESVTLTVDLAALIGRPGRRQVCSGCGEEIINQREIRQEDALLCRACAGESYYSSEPLLFLPTGACAIATPTSAASGAKARLRRTSTTTP
jgi:formylmethanofuran dehydrogenase subunit E